MHPIYKFGSEAQRSELLPRLGSGELVGCFGLTEPNAGSNPGGLETVATPQPGGDFVLNGSKMWCVAAAAWGANPSPRSHCLPLCAAGSRMPRSPTSS